MTATITELRAALDAATSDDERLEAMLGLAEALGLDDPRESFMLAGQSVELAERVYAERHLAEGLYLMGEANTFMGYAQQSLPLFERARGVFQKLKDVRGIAKTDAGFGRAYLWLNEFPRAMEILQSARAAAVEANDRHLLAWCIGCIGNAHRSMGEFIPALEHFKEARAICEELDHRPGAATWLNYIGAAHLDLEEYAPAMEHLQEALRLSEVLEYRWLQALCIQTIGMVYQHLEEHTLALEHHQTALAVYTELDIPWGMAWSAWGIGWHHSLHGEYASALERYRMNRALWDRYGYVQRVATADISIACVLVELGEYRQAMEHVESAQRLSEQIGDPAGRAWAIGRLGWLYAMEQFDGYDLKRAEEMFLLAIDMTLELGIKPSWAHYQLAEVYRKQGMWEQAHHHLARHHELVAEARYYEAQKKAQQFEHRRQLVELEKRRAMEEHEKELQRMKAEQIERELGNSTLQLLAQTELLRDLRNDLLKISRRIPPTEPASRELRERVKKLPCESVDWERYDTQFRTVHPDFIRNLTARAPDLTATEVRICTMLRMNLKSHEIAGIFCITENGVEFHRRNIRRKLKLAKEEKLPVVLGAM